MKRWKKLSIICVLSGLTFYADEIYAQHGREIRAVWIATNYGLDWPPKTFDSETQKESLIEIFDRIKKLKLNTIYFQVRSQSTTFYKSSREPYSPYLTGGFNKQPDYDPLKFAVEEAHKRGLEIHAWINLLNCYSADKNYNYLQNVPILKDNPNWIVDHKEKTDSYKWIDPAYKEAADYLAGLMEELALNYDIDGIQFDYARYPGRIFNDQASYALYCGDGDKHEWRRDNINKLIKILYEKIKSIKPKIKVGAAPLGIYESIKDVSGLSAKSSAYQDSRRWLLDGYIDYLVPQIYWDFYKNPKFHKAVDDWSGYIKYGPIIAGIAAYKESVFNDLKEMVNYARTAGLNGCAFYRFSDINKMQSSLFDYFAFPPISSKIDNLPPHPPLNVRLENENGAYFIRWDKPRKASDGDYPAYYAIHRLTGKNELCVPGNMIDVVDTFSMVIDADDHLTCNPYLAIVALDKLWNASSPVAIPIEFNELSNNTVNNQPKLVKIKENLYKLVYYADDNALLEILFMKEGNDEHFAYFEVEKGENTMELSINKRGAEGIKIKNLTANKLYSMRF